jgi:bacillithiol system protein YtxJ
MFKDRVVNLSTPEEVQSFLDAHPTSVIFKAGTCHKTMQGFGFLQEKLEPREDLMLGIIRVVEWRSSSNMVEEMTGISHESPQVLLFKDGEAVFDVDNWNITPEVLDAGFDKAPPSGDVKATEGSTTSDLSRYMQVLEQYLTGIMNHQKFESVYTTMFRDDASLRSRDEVEVLNSIFGDVDQHMNMHLMMAGRSEDDKVRERAEVAFGKLKELVQAPA